MNVSFFSILFLLSCTIASAQKANYSTLFIPDSLRQNANAVLRSCDIDITIASQRSMTIKTRRVLTVLNEKGLSCIDAMDMYNKRRTVKNIEAVVYDALGLEIKKLRRKDFTDVAAAADGSSFFSDSRYIYLDYKPLNYPFTIVYESEVETSNTAFIRSWRPIDNYNQGIESSVLQVSYPAALHLRKKESHFDGFPIEKTTDTEQKLSYSISNVPPQRYEEFAPDAGVHPKLMLALENFHLEGVDGSAKNWQDFGKWYSDKVLQGTTELPEATKTKIKALVGDEKDPVAKAKIIYNYVQQKSRYISIQVGIGGWKPMLASDVDRLGYGDCKALSNYTKALLEVVDVPSYNTVLYGGRDKMNIDSDFVSMQGNHMILCVPNGSEYIWLECTSQDNPFGYQANFTDARNVLVMKPGGGEIIQTKVYNNKINSQISKGSYALSETGDLSGSISIVSEGSQYGDKQRVESMQPTEKEAHYKSYWDYINNLKIVKTAFSNDKEKVRFTENMEISASNYGNLSGNRMMFAVNSYNQFTTAIKKIRNRKLPFEIARGSYDEDEITIALPAGFGVEALPKDFELSGKFGDYKTSIVKTDGQHLIYKRSFYLKEGMYSNTEYDAFRLFMEQVSKNDNAKIILLKNQ